MSGNPASVTMPASVTIPASAAIDVAVGAIVLGDAVLIAKRAAHQHQGGLWEFPGGKWQVGETGFEALCRELKEELAIGVVSARPLIRLTHDYGDKKVTLSVWRVESFTGLPGFAGERMGAEGQPLKWAKIAQLDPDHFPVANKSIIHALQLPSQLAITPSLLTFAKVREYAMSAQRLGAGALQLRLPEVSPQAFMAIAEPLADECRERGMLLILNASPWCLPDRPRAFADAWRQLLTHLGPFGGVHLPVALLDSPAVHELLDAAHWRFAACHNQIEITQAKALGADALLLSPVLATTSHPKTMPLGWSAFEALVQQAACPVYALGGMVPQRMSDVWERFGQGVAAISAYQS